MKIDVKSWLGKLFKKEAKPSELDDSQKSLVAEILEKSKGNVSQIIENCGKNEISEEKMWEKIEAEFTRIFDEIKKITGEEIAQEIFAQS